MTTEVRTHQSLLRLVEPHFVALSRRLAGYRTCVLSERPLSHGTRPADNAKICCVFRMIYAHEALSFLCCVLVSLTLWLNSFGISCRRVTFACKTEGKEVTKKIFFCFPVLSTCSNAQLLINSSPCVMFILPYRCFTFYISVSFFLAFPLPFSMFYHFLLCLHICRYSNIFMLCCVSALPIYSIKTYGIFKDLTHPLSFFYVVYSV